MNNDTRTSSRSLAVQGSSPRFPRLALFVLGFASFAMVTAEMLPAAVLPQMSAGLGVKAHDIGLLVSIWAAVVVVASFPLVRLTRRLARRRVIVASLVALAASSLLTAVAPTYGAAIAGRILGALAVGLLWATINAFTADLVDDNHLARAVARVLGGATLGMVFGIPLGSFLGEEAGWRSAFGVLAALSIVAAAAVLIAVPSPPQVAPIDSLPGSEPGETGDLERQSRSRAGMKSLLVITTLVALMLVGHYGAYTFITGLVAPIAVATPGGTGGLLFVYGVASATGVLLSGRLGRRTGPALVGSAVALTISLLALSFVHVSPVLGTAVIVTWGFASGALPAFAQTAILRAAGSQHRGFAGALIPVLFNLGIAIGAAFASLIVGGWGFVALTPLAALIVALATVSIALAERSRRFAQQ